MVPSVALRHSRLKLSLPNQDELMKEMGALPTKNEVGIRIKQCLDTVEKMADTSSHLKGSYVRTLRVAARTIQAAGEELARWSYNRPNVERLQLEKAELRSQLSSITVVDDFLREEICVLRQRLNSRNHRKPRRRRAASL